LADADVNFPTSRQQSGNSYVAEIIDVYEGFNAKYGPKGREGLYIKITFESTGNKRDIFYPALPSVKTDRLIQALTASDELALDLDEITWKGLIGYKMRWQNGIIPREITDRETGERVKRDAKVEYPTEIVATPTSGVTQQSTTTTDNGTSAPPVETPAGDDTSDSNYEAFKDEVMALSDGKSLRAARLAAAQEASIRAYPADFREKLNKGTVFTELIDAGRLTESEVDGEKVFQVTV